MAFTGKTVGTSQSDVKGSTADEFSRSSIEVVNPHSEPVFAKILKIVRREREPTHARAREGNSPPKPTRAAEAPPRSRPCERIRNTRS